MNRALLKMALDALIDSVDDSREVLNTHIGQWGADWRFERVARMRKTIENGDAAIAALEAELDKPDQAFAIWLHAADIEMPWDKTLPYKLDFEKDESWACAVPLLARMKT